MAKKRKPEVDRNEVLPLLSQIVELRCMIMQHCQALKGVCDLLAQGKTQAAIARLDGTVTAMLAASRGMCAGLVIPCPSCQCDQDVSAWVDDKRCHNCGEILEVPKLPPEFPRE